MGRVEDHIGGRLRGRDIPPDLRRLVELELDGVLTGPDSVQPFPEIHVLGPHDPHGWSRGRPSRDPDTVANRRAIDDVVAHLALVLAGPDGNSYGYWLHPDEPPTDRPTIVKISSEGEFRTLDGESLVEAIVYEYLRDDVDYDEDDYDEDEEDDDYPARLVAFCARHGLTLAASRDALRGAATVVDPALLHSRQYKRYRPYTARPAWADGDDAALVGLPVTDPRLREFLDLLGFPDPEVSIAALDNGLGEVRLQSPVVAVNLSLYLDPDDSWWLYLARYNRPAGRPRQAPVPYGFSFDEDRATTRARFGPPAHTALLVPADRWLFGRVVAYVLFTDQTGPPKYIEFWPDDVPRR